MAKEKRALTEGEKMKNQDTRRIIRIMILLILIIIFLGSSLYIGDYYYKSYKNSKNNKSYHQPDNLFQRKNKIHPIDW